MHSTFISFFPHQAGLPAELALQIFLLLYIFQSAAFSDSSLQLPVSIVSQQQSPIECFSLLTSPISCFPKIECTTAVSLPVVFTTGIGLHRTFLHTMIENFKYSMGNNLPLCGVVYVNIRESMHTVRKRVHTAWKDCSTVQKRSPNVRKLYRTASGALTSLLEIFPPASGRTSPLVSTNFLEVS